MKPGNRLPDDQAEIVFSDVFVEQLEACSSVERLEIMTTVVALCSDPGGSHTLSARGNDRMLVGWNTVAVVEKTKRVVYRVDENVASIYVLCVGPRRNDEVYDLATSLASSGLLTDEEVTQLWEALSLLDVAAESVGLDGWDYLPEAAPDGQQRAAVAAGLLSESMAALLSKDEISAALERGWGENGPDKTKALLAALQRARGGAHFDSAEWVMTNRQEDRCSKQMPRAGRKCIRKAGHPGPHRASA
ncbi:MULTISPECIES: type II toxin-antitoxin system RelE family toxin [Cryobacterium]|uniref:Uncharacterized protein n=1 Tax=Cryobacterium shii TaxID=1259235 RepID=A0AAQ2C5V7_9MICO|nr:MULTISPECIES: hypothetical protein [Cryobacterium]TFB59925.1 hypothetical protein E3N94_02770 [Cryobacterium sp. Sr3]TFC45929.1 hypothetical protein E3O49_10480 [Cryobacterium shii]